MPINNHPEVRSVLSDVSMRGGKPTPKGMPSKHAATTAIITCRSFSSRFEYCKVPGKIIDARLHVHIPPSRPCIKDITFSFKEQYLIVVSDCRAEFRVTYV